MGALRRWSGTGSWRVCSISCCDGAVGGVDGVGFGSEGEVDDGFGEGQVAFGGAEELHGLLGAQAEVERFGSGEADVFDGHADDAAGEIERVFAGGEHAGQPIERGVGIGVAHALVQRGDEVVVLFARLVVHQHALLDGFDGDGAVDVLCRRHTVALGLRELGGDFEGVVGRRGNRRWSSWR